jgi:asparagine synthetase B (glutamine-hydrolysing)
VTIQFDGFNPLTVSGARDFAGEVGLSHLVIPVKAVEFLAAFEALAGLTPEPVFDLDLAIVYAALKKYDRRIAGDVFISGMGSDQWFGNMALEDRFGGFDARLDWAVIDVDAHQRAAQANGCKFVFPFLSDTMLAMSQSVPASMKKDKKLLRSLAGSNTIPQTGARTELQVPDVMRRMLIKTYGDRAWPAPVSAEGGGYDQPLRQILLGLWLEKKKDSNVHEETDHQRR